MSETPSIPDDPAMLIRRLDADAIRTRLDEIDRERAALLVLLRAAKRVQSLDRKGARRAV